jgi:transposase
VAQVEPKALLGDKGYDADSLINSLEVRAIKAVIPPKSNRKVKRVCDFALYAERNLVERFFNTIKHYRGIATRYEKTAREKATVVLAGLCHVLSHTLPAVGIVVRCQRSWVGCR